MSSGRKKDPYYENTDNTDDYISERNIDTNSRPKNLIINQSKFQNDKFKNQ